MMVTLVMTRSGAPAAEVNWLSMPMPSRRLLPPPKTISSPEGAAQIALDLDEEPGIAEADAVAGGRTEQPDIFLT